MRSVWVAPAAHHRHPPQRSERAASAVDAVAPAKVLEANTAAAMAEQQAMHTGAALAAAQEQLLHDLATTQEQLRQEGHWRAEAEGRAHEAQLLLGSG